MLESLDVMIGIITVYLMFALACTATVEAISSWFEVRSKNLEAALGEFLHGDLAQGKSFVKAFFAHPIVQTLSQGRDGKPSYIDPEIVGRAVTDLINAGDGASSLKQAIEKLPGTAQSNRIKGVLESLQRDAVDIAEFRKLIESHYDAAMDRASGWYKRKTQTIALIASALFVIFANVDTISLANSLSTDPAAKARMLEIAQRQVDATKQEKPAASTTDAGALKDARDRSEKAGEALAQANADISSAGIQLGWQALPVGYGNWASKIVGLLISILAISLGAPFWFDLLSRVMQVRAAGILPRERKPAVAGDARTGS